MGKFRLRFILRDLLWLFVVAAVVFGWWTEHKKHADQIAALEIEVRHAKAASKVAQYELQANVRAFEKFSGQFRQAGKE